jgi:hypothetical protein
MPAYQRPWSVPGLPPASEFYDCLQSMVAAVVFSYTAIEVFANSLIPNEYNYSSERTDKKCTECYSKEQIERYISLDSKLDKVLPEICKVQSPKGTHIWDKYLKLKKLRDRLIHLRTGDWRGRLPEHANDWIWTHMLSKEGRNVSLFAFEVISYYLKDKKPRWAVRFELSQKQKKAT